tara:strand:+ start:177 stop:437 length:261 start_codon:yes stop_codon:yes gene_type:complete
MSLWDDLLDGAKDLSESLIEKGGDALDNVIDNISLQREINDADKANDATVPVKTTTSPMVNQSNEKYLYIGGGVLALILVLVILKK